MSDPPRHLPLEVDPSVRIPGPARVLVTNDDGIGSPGLHALARALAGDHDVVVVAPSSDVSGAGTSIGRLSTDEPAPIVRVDLDDLEAYTIDGPPGLAVMSAALGAFGGTPDLVVSGPNAGLNTGTSIIHSGTVGAALTAHTFGISGLALSLAPGERWEWETVLPVARAATRWIRRRPAVTTLNVNVPARAPEAVRGSRWATIDRFGHFSVASQTEGAAGTVLDLDVHERRTPRDPDCDTALCLDGYVALTLLSPLGAAPSPQEDPAAVSGIATDR